LPVVQAKRPEVDVAPFGQSFSEENAIAARGLEMRRIVRVEVTFLEDGTPLPLEDSMKVKYWHRVWKGAAFRRYGDQNAGSLGWNAVDDGSPWAKRDDPNPSD